MAACNRRYEIFLLALKNISLVFTSDLGSRREISYQRAVIMKYPLYMNYVFKCYL